MVRVTTEEVSYVQLRPALIGAVLRGIADTYSSLSQSLEEQFQNAVDAGAPNVEIFINRMGKFTSVSDNGEGVTAKEFNDSLRTLLQSTKGKDKFGRFARGKISALTKCREFTFQSRGKSGPPHRWAFHCSEILESVDFPMIPCEVISPSKEKPWWRTQVLMKGVFFNDAVKFRVDLAELKATILSRYGTNMRKLGTVVKIFYLDENGKKHEECFSAKSYSGEALKVWESDADTPAGKVIVRLYKSDGSSPIPVTIGQIGDPFRIDWKTFFQSVNAFSSRSKRVTFDCGKDINALFRSGIVSGEIECANISINPNRESFERNEALEWFILILQDWFEKVGKKIHDDAEITAKSSLYQQIAMDAIQRIEKHPLVDQFLQLVKFGTVGKGHANTGAKVLGIIQATDANKGHDKGKGTYSTGAPPQTRNAPEESVTRPGQVPILVAGDGSNDRKIVRKDSRGLIVEVSPFEGLTGANAPLFRVELDLGKVVINRLAPDFNASADGGVKALRRFIDMVIMAALQAVTSSDFDRERMALEQFVRNTNRVFLAGDQRTL